MNCYKQKIQNELKKTMDKFEKSQIHPIKTHLIHKKKILNHTEGNSRKLFKQRLNYQQMTLPMNNEKQCNILNFYNLFTINQKTIQQMQQDQNYVRQIFYFKNIRKIQNHQNYIVLYLIDSLNTAKPISNTLKQYSHHKNQKLRYLGSQLEKLEKKLKLSSIENNTDLSITEQTYKMLQNVGKSPFICKISSQKLIISKSLLQICQYDIEQFIVSILTKKITFFKGPTYSNYFQILQKRIEIYSFLSDVLQGSIPLATFSQIARVNFSGEMITNNNIVYHCNMILSMPIPLVQLITWDQMIKSKQLVNQSIRHEQLARYSQKILIKSYKTLQYLINLPKNLIPLNSSKTASYIQINSHVNIDEKSQKNSSDQQLQKSNFTLSFH